MVPSPSLETDLDQLALLAMIRGDGAEQGTFARAAHLVRSRHVSNFTDLELLLEAPPPDTDIELISRLRYIHDAGTWVLLESAIADLPSDLRWLFESGAVTIEQLATLYQGLGTTTAADLGVALESHAIRHLPSFDEAVEEAIATALPSLRSAVTRIPLGRATGIVEPILAHLRSRTDVEWALPAGSLRRGQETVGDIEVVASAADPREAIEDLSRLPDVLRCLHRSESRVYLLFERVQVGVRFPQPDTAGAVLVHLTGSSGHVAALRAHATELGWRLAADGLFSPDGALHSTPTEEAVYAALQLPLIPAEIRSGDDEVEIARRGALPMLVARSDVRGDLHMHTTWSDGRDSTEDMIRASLALGYEYVAITDHSQRSAAARNLTAKTVPRQAEEIAALRTRFPGITILHGCEVDIMPDGQLDFPDGVLEQFDLVLASLHDRAGQSSDELLQRYIAAMEHRLVTLITHPTNRLVPSRQGYVLDYDRLFEVAVETGTALEIDGAPTHLDMDGALARRAIAAGVTVSVDSDCHRADVLDRQMGLGVTTARRGWVEPRHVLNARPLADVRAFIARKRRR